MSSDPVSLQVARGDSPVSQRCVLVLPSTAEFDSRTYRIARTLHGRGHQVTVIARWKPGLPRHEVHEAGYPIVRVAASGLEGLPLPQLWLHARAAVRSIRRRVGAAPQQPADTSAPGWAHPSAGSDRRGLTGYLERVRIFLMIRSQRRRALEVAPAADIYHGMALMGIPVAVALGRRHRARVVYDSRDIYLLAANLARLRGPIRRLLARLERSWAHAADRVLTVNRPYAEQLARRLDVPEPAIVMNCSYRFTPPDPPERRFQELLGLAPETRVVLYHGGFSRGRGVEQLAAAIHEVPRAVLVVMGYGALEARFRAMANEPGNRGRIFILAAVPPTELLSWVAAADVVGVLFQKDTINNYLSTPNKFLEAMAAGVPSVVSDHPGMGPIARDTGCGIAVDPTDMPGVAAAIRAIVDGTPEERAAWRARALAAAHARYNWETQVETLLDEYGRLTGRPW
jgi:glycosyltransferase involved in cell wall biosynthesis